MSGSRESRRRCRRFHRDVRAHERRLKKRFGKGWWTDDIRAQAERIAHAEVAEAMNGGARD